MPVGGFIDHVVCLPLHVQGGDVGEGGGGKRAWLSKFYSGVCFCEIRFSLGCTQSSGLV